MDQISVKRTLNRFRDMERETSPSEHMRVLTERHAFLKKGLSANPANGYYRRELRALEWMMGIINEAKGPDPFRNEPGVYVIHVRDLRGNDHKVRNVKATDPKSAVDKVGHQVLHDRRQNSERKVYTREWMNPDSVYPSVIIYHGDAKVCEIIAEERCTK